MVLQPLLDRFISYYEPKSLGDSCGSGPLHIQVPEGHRVRHRLRSAFFARNEVELIVDAPAVSDAIRRAVLEHQLWTRRRQNRRPKSDRDRRRNGIAGTFRDAI